MIIYKKDNIVLKWNKRKHTFLLFVDGIFKGSHEDHDPRIEDFLFNEGFKVFLRSV